MEDEKAVLRVKQGGSLEISGSFTLTGPDGKPIKIDGSVFICRCGQSSKNPFCDGTHKRTGFSE